MHRERTSPLFVAWLLCLLGLSGCSREEPQAGNGLDSLRSEPAPIGRPATKDDVLAFLGPVFVPVITEPDHIRIYRISNQRNPDDPRDKIAGYPVLRIGGEVDALHRADWSSSCTTPQGFYFLRQQFEKPRNGSGPFGCVFSPGVAVEFIKGGEHRFVLLCFSCSEWRFLNPPDTEHRRDHFLGMSRRLVDLVRFSFPDDPAFAPPPASTTPPKNP